MAIPDLMLCKSGVATEGHPYKSFIRQKVPVSVGLALHESHVNPDHVNPVKHADRAKAGKGHFLQD
jgi:hypothetical protein